MEKPFILAAHGDRLVLASLRTELERLYSNVFKVVGATDVHGVLDLLDHLRSPVAMIIGDATTIGEVRSHIGLEASKVVIVAPYSDVATVHQRLTELDAHEVVVSPWSGDSLHDGVDDLLNDWLALHTAGESLVMIGHRWARDAHELRDFLGRNHVPFRWVDLDHGDEGVRLLDGAGLSDAKLPVVLRAEGDALVAPNIDDLADALSMHHHPTRQYYDLVIVGGGPAGLAAAVYGASEGLSTLLVERDAVGGQAGTSSKIENYLGFPNGVSGAELAERALAQATRFGAEVLAPQEVTKLSLDGRYKVLDLADGRSVSGAALVVATGVTYREMHAESLRALTGAGVFYGAATTEALDAAGEDVIVVGSANSAGQGALYFAKFARSVTMIVKAADLRETMSAYLADQIEASPSISVRVQSRVVEAHGEDSLEAISIETKSKVVRLETRFLFVFIGAEPRNEWLGGLVAADDRGYLYTGRDAENEGWPLSRDPMHLECSVPGVFAAGDVRHGSIRRVAGGVGEGSTAVQLVHRYLASVH
ncbi:MAG: FAD-dependent oxidoreductase [Acidimicrobiia bacterium]|nr:FAD-dependent oxidoreductase [Acidimicrobiia bacterium]